MRKAKKILRKLLSAFRDEIASKPITKERNSLVDSATFLIER
ncbi:MAG: hypothetical protein BROFUL_01477 [Candidatus Brocadia fulgida]|uniref:Uncharacterized protein n=1 Tax=Candidatus Brocadia fulgida TaxID=380242 RepID=A0A0M2UZA9_9BACT|nr:MAG: hypothetical protein BROFUL_01477 [Candidatus Brocadia fulgida]